MIKAPYDMAKTLLYVFLGTFLLITLMLATTGRSPLTSILVLINGFCFYAACWFTIKAKARSGWWILAPLLLVYFGAFVVWLLNDKSPPPKEGELPEWAR